MSTTLSGPGDSTAAGSVFRLFEERAKLTTIRQTMLAAHAHHYEHDLERAR